MDYQGELFTDGLADKIADDFLNRLRTDGATDEDLKLAVLKVFYRHVSGQLRRYPPKLRDRFILWLVEEFLEHD